MVSSHIRRTVAAGAAATLALVVVQAALAAESPVIRYNAADQAAAKALVLKASDLGAGWKGGAQKPNPAATSPCSNWKPKQADLVITGAAESKFTGTGATITSSSMVYRTPRMAQLDWQRTVVHPDAARCMRESFSGDAEMALVSLERTAFPKVAAVATRYRVVLDYTSAEAAEPVRLLMDMVVFGRGRNLLSLSVIAPYADRAAAHGAEVRLARTLASRIRA